MESDSAVALVLGYSAWKDPKNRRREVIYQALLGIKGSFPLFHAEQIVKRELRKKGLDYQLKNDEVRNLLEELVRKKDMRHFMGNKKRYIWIN